jgi:hypothetical protein
MNRPGSSVEHVSNLPVLVGPVEARAGDRM